MLVCDHCYDEPQQQLRAIAIAADPIPISNPRIQDFVTAETDYRTTQGNTTDQTTGIPIPGGDQRITQNDAYRVPQQTGEPPGGLNILPGALLNEVDYGNPTLPYGNTAIPTTGWLPGVNYIIWTNGTVTQIGWYNDQGELVTWLVTTG